MKTLGVVGATLLVLASTACSSSSDGETTVAGPACGDREPKVTGKIDGADVSLVRVTSVSRFSNKFDVTTAQGTLSLEFNKSLFDGETGPARGSFVDSEGALSS